MNKGKSSTSMMGRWIAVILFTSIFSGVNAQWWSEGFGNSVDCSETDSVRNYAGGNGPWSITYPSVAIQDSIGGYWFVSNRESYTGLGNCGDGCQQDTSLKSNSLHISTNSPGIVDAGAIFENDSTTDAIAWSPAITTNGASQLYLEFDYIEGGGAGDNGSVMLAVGSTAVPVALFDPAKTTGSCGIDGEWTRAGIFIDSSYNSLLNSFYLGFRWQSNGDGNGQMPSFAIDSVWLKDTVPPATFNFATSDTICQGDNVDFMNTTIGLNNQYNWLFPGGTPNSSTAKNPQNISYATPGVYPVTLTVTNPNGSVTTTDSVYVLDCQPPTPIISASTQYICKGQCIDFTDQSLNGSFGKGQWQWLFQGGTPNNSTAQNPTNICYFTAGTYDVTLTVADTVTGESRDSVFVDFITVGDCSVPLASFTSNDSGNTCNNDFIEFYALVEGPPDVITWIFEGGNPATVTGPADSLDTIEVFYPNPGTFDVTIIATNPAGEASDTVLNYITIDTCPIPTSVIDANRTTICPQTEVQFIDNSIAPREWYWEFPGGQPSSSTDQFPPPITYTTPGEYPVVLITRNVNGVDTLIAEGYIIVDSCNVPEPRFQLETDSICRSTCVQWFNTSKYLDITDTTDSFAFIFWYHPYPDSITGTSADTISSATPGYEWMALDSNLIAFHDTFFLVYEDYFPVMAPVWNQNDPIFCYDDSATIGLQIFAYNEHGVGVLNEQDLPILNIGGSYPKLNTGPDIGENRSTLTDVTIRKDNPESRFFLDDTVRFQVTGTAPYFNWFPEEGLSCYDCPRPIVYPTETRKYFVTNYDDYGCQAYDSLVVYVEEAYYAGIPNIFSPNGDDNNDILWVRGNGIESEGFIMRIYDRYGAVVFESFTQNEGWDGTVKGAPGPAGSYRYYVKFVFENGEVQELTGNVTLVRY